MHAMKACGGNRSMTPLIFKYRTKWRQVVNFVPPVALSPREIAAGTHWIGDGVASRTSQDVLEKIKTFHFPGINPRFVCRPFCSLVTSDSALSRKEKITWSDKQNTIALVNTIY
jgi:hypothetical protein